MKRAIWQPAATPFRGVAPIELSAIPPKSGRDLLSSAQAIKTGLRKSQWTFQCARGLSGFERLRPAWQALVDQLPHASYMQQPAWIAAYLQSLAPHAAAEVVFVTAHHDGRLDAVLALRQRSGWRSQLLPQLHMIEGPHMVLADGVAERGQSQVWAEMLHWLGQQREVRWSSLHLPVVSADSVLGEALHAHHTTHRLQAPRTQSAWLDCSAGVEHALSGVSRSFRQNLRRLTRRAESQGSLTYRVVTDPSELNAALDEFLRVESSGWKGDSGTAIAHNPQLVAFYRQLARDFGAQGRCRINLLSLDGVTIAAQFGLVSDRQLNLLKIGFSQEHAAVAPGNLIMRDTIEQVCADSSLDRLCFVTHPPWAHLWKPQLTPVDYITLFAPTLKGTLLHHVSAWRQARRQRAEQACKATTEVSAPTDGTADQPQMCPTSSSSSSN